MMSSDGKLSKLLRNLENEQKILSDAQVVSSSSSINTPVAIEGENNMESCWTDIGKLQILQDTIGFEIEQALAEKLLVKAQLAGLDKQDIKLIDTVCIYMECQFSSL